MGYKDVAIAQLAEHQIEDLKVDFSLQVKRL